MPTFLDVPSTPQPSKVASMLSSSSAVPSSAPPGTKKIQIISADSDGSSSDNDDDDDLPPPILGEGLKVTELNKSSPSAPPEGERQESSTSTIICVTKRRRPI